MPNNILLKKSSIAGKIPLVGDLSYGELALNYNDGKLYYKTSDNEIKHFISTSTTATLFVDNLTQATSTTTGALTVSGGAGVGGNLYVGGNLVVNGAVTVSQIVQVVTATTYLTDVGALVLASGTINLTLPNATVNSGKNITIKNVGLGEITVLTTSTQTIDGESEFILRYQNSAFTLLSDGNNWVIT